MTEFTKTVRIGTVPTYPGSKRFISVFCKVEYVEGRLSITGVEGPLPSGNALGGCGQIHGSLSTDSALTEYKPAPNWSRAKLVEFLRVWRRWHLNDVNAGTSAQETWLRDNPIEVNYPENHYEKAGAALEAAGLNPDPVEMGKNGKPYRYGSAWRREEVPADVLTFLGALPDADKTPAWV